MNLHSRCLFLMFCLLGGGCQKKPALAPSGDLQSILAPLPMGATVYNDELKHEISLLDQLLSRRIDQRQLEITKKALMLGKTQGANLAINEPLANLLMTLPELIHSPSDLTEVKKKWYKAKLFFLRRRFIEAATLMTEIVKEEPQFIEARNWRARAIFFLGNPDLAVKDLEGIVTSAKKTSPQSLEALYLIGAIIYESNAIDKKRLDTGIHAWRQYLKLALTDKDVNAEVENGLKELLARKDGSVQKANILDPFTPNHTYSPEKNAVLTAFMREELLLALELCDKNLKETYDKELAVIKARIFIKTGRIDEAAELFTTLIKKFPNYAPAFHYRGMAFMLKGQTKEAIASWQKTLLIDQNYARSNNLDQRIAVAKKMLEPTIKTP